MNAVDLGDALENCRPYLRLLAQLNLAPSVKPKIDASDIVQQTLLQAYQARTDFRGQTETELRAWLRRILTRNLIHARRDFSRQKRDIAREQAIENALEASSVRIDGWLP